LPIRPLLRSSPVYAGVDVSLKLMFSRVNK